MSYKRLIPCILIADGEAVKWFDDREVIAHDVVRLAKEYRKSSSKMRQLQTSAFCSERIVEDEQDKTCK